MEGRNVSYKRTTSNKLATKNSQMARLRVGFR